MNGASLLGSRGLCGCTYLVLHVLEQAADCMILDKRLGDNNASLSYPELQGG